MDRERRIQPLDYYPPKRVKQPDTPESIRWRHYRVFYRVGLAALFVVIAFYVGPNEIMFGQLKRPTPADLIPVVQQECAATVRAMKEYQRDTGQLPNAVEDLSPKYLPPNSSRQQAVHNGAFSYWTRYNELITYDFSPSTEGWYVQGAFASGRIPLPPVKISPLSQPTSQPR